MFAETGAVKKNQACAPFPGTGALDCDRNVEGSAGFREGGNILLSGALVEVDSQEPTRFVLEQRVTAHNVSAQVVSNDLVLNVDEGVIHAITALTPGLETRIGTV